ncbi:Hypothetical protein PHPALM_5827, partial [Phytophthora palmivora]
CSLWKLPGRSMRTSSTTESTSAPASTRGSTRRTCCPSPSFRSNCGASSPLFLNRTRPMTTTSANSLTLPVLDTHPRRWHRHLCRHVRLLGAPVAPTRTKTPLLPSHWTSALPSRMNFCNKCCPPAVSSHPTLRRLPSLRLLAASLTTTMAMTTAFMSC